MTIKIRNKNIKTRIYNTILNSGQKETKEKIFLKSQKKIQKMTTKNNSKILKLAIKNTSPAFKINKQKMKRRKKKAVKEIPYFIKNDFFRINTAIKHITLNSKSNSEFSNFYSKFSQEIMKSSRSKSESIVQKTEIQKRALLKKNLFFKFRWKKR